MSLSELGKAVWCSSAFAFTLPMLGPCLSLPTHTRPWHYDAHDALWYGQGTASRSPHRRYPRRRHSFHFFSQFPMDYDRRSAVSSFYGGRRSSVDALNREYAAPPSSNPRARCDSSSSGFNPNGTLPRGAARAHGAGYNRMSYSDAGREEPVKGGNDEVKRPNEDGWDIYADFNNAGPRYSHAGPHIQSLSKRTNVCEE
jgi:hypothetical protein